MSVVDIALSVLTLVVMGLYIWLVVVGLTAMVRILNRTGYSGWWLLIGFVPIVGVVALSRFSKAKWTIAADDVQSRISSQI